MAKQLQIRGGTTVQHSTFTGALREITIDTDKDVVVVHDGTTVGGFPLAKQTSVDSKVTKVTSTDNAIVRFNGATGDIQNSNVIIDDNGNVGIGVAPSTSWFSGAKILQLGASGSLTNNSTNTTMLVHNAILGDSNSLYQISGQQASRYQQSNGVHAWYTAPSGTAGNAITWNTAMTLDANGSLYVNPIGNSSAFRAYTTGASNVNYTSISSQVASTNWLHFYGLSSDGATSNIVIYGNGNVKNANNSYGAFSDVKLKENIVDTSPKLDKLMQVRVVNYNLIGDDQKQIGVIAQEVEKIFPGIVYETKDTKQVEVTKTRDITDEEGNVTSEEYTETQTVETGEVTKNVKYSVIYMMMLKGMQEQQAIINDLKARIEILEGK